MNTLAFLGPEGTFAHAAALKLGIAGGAAAAPVAGAQLEPLPSVTEAIDRVRAGSVDGAVVPLENSVEGAVPATLDELSAGSPLIIAAETYLPVEFALLARGGTTLADIGSVATHPHAEAQTRRWRLAQLPGATCELVSSTAGAAEAVSRGTYDAAIAAAVAGERYGLVSLVPDIADHPGAVTRFVLLRRPGAPPEPTGNDRTTLVAYLREDHSGALLEILTEFATRAVNLTRIESRPTKDRLGHYCFSIDCEGHVAEARVGDALAALRRVCADVRYLGSYARRDGELDSVPRGRTDADFADADEWLARVRATGSA